MGERLHFVVPMVVLIFIGSFFEVKADNNTKIECGTEKGEPQFCGEGAVCISGRVNSTCICERGYTGDPFVQCVRKSDVECLSSSECTASQTCLNEKCIDSCDGTCGVNAACIATNHHPICSCPAGYSGDPFVSCSRDSVTGNATCDHSCGTNTKCSIVDNKVLCSCLPGHQGNPLEACAQECKSHGECPSSTPACVKGFCTDPCKNVCGVHAECQVVELAPVCTCPQGTTGNPLTRCNGLENPCQPTPCGANTACRVINDRPICSCLAGYEGDAFVRCHKFLCNSDSDCGENASCVDGLSFLVHKECKCREGHYGNPFRSCIKGPTCSTDSDCPSSRPSCVKSTCSDECNNVCGLNAQCERSLSVCRCPEGMTGNPFILCASFQYEKP